MKGRRIAILVAGALVAGLTLGGLGIASAATPKSHKVVAAKHVRHKAKPKVATPIAKLSALTGMPVQQITGLRNSVDPTTFFDQMIALQQTRLDALVAAGRMTAAQEQTTLDSMRSMMQAMLGFVPGSGAPTGSVLPTMPAGYGPGYGMPGFGTTGTIPATGTPGFGPGGMMGWVPGSGVPTGSALPTMPGFGTTGTIPATGTPGFGPGGMMGWVPPTGTTTPTTPTVPVAHAPGMMGSGPGMMGYVTP